MRISSSWLSFISTLVLLKTCIAQLSPIEEALVKIRDQTASNNTFLGSHEIQLWKGRLAQATAQTPPESTALAMQSLGIAQLRLGLEKEAVQTLGQGFQKARQAKVSPE